MEIGLIGLGKMGLNLAKNMRDHQIEVVAFDLFAEARQAATKAQIKTVTDLQSFGQCYQLANPLTIQLKNSVSC